jgi:hypothetical protein
MLGTPGVARRKSAQPSRPHLAVREHAITDPQLCLLSITVKVVLGLFVTAALVLAVCAYCQQEPHYVRSSYGATRRASRPERCVGSGCRSGGSPHSFTLRRRPAARSRTGSGRNASGRRDV